MARQQVSSFQLYCEQCGYEAHELHIVKRHLMYCKDCTDAQKRRDRFKREEKDWDRVVDQKDTE